MTDLIMDQWWNTLGDDEEHLLQVRNVRQQSGMVVGRVVALRNIAQSFRAEAWRNGGWVAVRDCATPQLAFQAIAEALA